MGVRIQGLREVRQALNRAKMRVATAVAAGVYGLGQEVMTDSKRRVPVKYGALKGSGYVTLPEVTERGASVELGYGGPAKAYAVVQHEHTEFHHPEGGEAKYLENAVNAASGGALRRVQEIARRQLLGGGGPASNEPTDPGQGR